MNRGDFFTLERKKETLYSDFLNSFDKNPTTGWLATLTNEDAIKQSMKNLILTNAGERFYDSNKGSKVRGSLFEPVDEGNLEILRIKIVEILGAYEPRIVNPIVGVTDDINRNAFRVQIFFSIANIIGPPVNLNLFIQKVR